MLDTKILSFFKAVECLNFTEAASRLYISQSAFSKQMIALEEELGFQLFIRDNRKKSIRLTSLGAIYYQEMKTVYKAYEKALERVYRCQRGLEGKLRIGILSGHDLHPKLKQMVFDFSHTSNLVQTELYNCSFAELGAGITNGKLDVALSLEVELEQYANCLCECLYEEQTCLLIPKDWEYEENKEYSIKDFHEKTFILAKENIGISKILNELCHSCGFKPKTIIAPDFETMLLWIEQGLGVAGSGEGHMEAGNPYIKKLKIREFRPMYFAVGWNKENYNPLISEFVESLLNNQIKEPAPL